MQRATGMAADERGVGSGPIETAKLNGVDPMAWRTDVRERVVVSRTKANAMHTLLPWNWAVATPTQIPMLSVRNHLGRSLISDRSLPHRLQYSPACSFCYVIDMTNTAHSIAYYLCW